MYFTDREESIATRVEIRKFLSKRGVTLERKGNEYNVLGKPNVMFIGCYYYDHDYCFIGNALDYCMCELSMDYVEAMGVFLEFQIGRENQRYDLY